ncbi:MAG TPA: YdcF family protein [Acetobacteraceae bacterium]|nr:YdcF family protein [Acetobacteraceae bacterium]
MMTIGIGIAVIGVALAFGGGFAWFVHRVEMPGQTPPRTDGIVAFTGGPERVETALRLLAEGRADRLLLSGIGGGAELAELARRAGVDPRPLAPHITIDRNATTTRGNATDTATWAHDNDIHSLLVVTAAYHMPRAMAELARTLPDVTLYPLPVAAPERPDRTAVPLRLVAEEYIKFLVTTAGLSAVLPMREPAPARTGHAG